MNASNARVDRIVEELMQKPLPKEERMRLLAELVARGEDLPDEVLDEALQKLMQRLTE